MNHNNKTSERHVYIGW